MSFTILIVEDKGYEQALMALRLREMLGADIVLWQAQTVLHAIALFAEHQASLDLIILDACVPGDEPTTHRLVRKWRAEGFAKPMIAASSDPYFCEMLKKAGCDEGGMKECAPGFAKHLLLGA